MTNTFQCRMQRMNVYWVLQVLICQVHLLSAQNAYLIVTIKAILGRYQANDVHNVPLH